MHADRDKLIRLSVRTHRIALALAARTDRKLKGLVEHLIKEAAKSLGIETTDCPTPGSREPSHP